MATAMTVITMGLLCSCGGGGSDGLGGGAGGSGGGAAATGGGGGAGAFSWPGTWTAQLDYEARCDFANSAFQNRTHSHAVTVQLRQAGSGYALEALGSYEMTGTGSASRLDLNGPLPLLDHNGNRTGSSNSTMITLAVTNVTPPNLASGTLTGQFDGSSGFQCEVHNGTVRLSR